MVSKIGPNGEPDKLTPEAEWSWNTHVARSKTKMLISDQYDKDKILYAKVTQHTFSLIFLELYLYIMSGMHALLPIKVW